MSHHADLAPLAVEIDGWDLYDEATFGDWGLRLVLEGSVAPGEVTQAASGWGNDVISAFTRGDDVAMVMSYIGDSERDAEELANALIAHIRDDMDAGPAGGIRWRPALSARQRLFVHRSDRRRYLLDRFNRQDRRRRHAPTTRHLIPRLVRPGAASNTVSWLASLAWRPRPVLLLDSCYFLPPPPPGE